MRHWKHVVTYLFLFCLFFQIPLRTVWAEEDTYYEEEYEEDPIPESYYYPIETNELPGWPQGPAIESASAVVMDMDSGAFLYSKNATAKMYPASTTKIMTTLLLVENCDLDAEITFSEIVFDLEEGSSHIGIKPGETMTLRDCAYGIMLESANDVSNGVAEYIGGSLSGFADMMNAKAAELGCVNTHFANPHGLYREDHYTCAYDMALIARAAFNNPVFREVATTRYHEIPETDLTEEIRYLVNHHKIMQKDSDYYRDWCMGGKTGYTEACLNTLVTFGERDGQHLVGVVFRVNGAGKAYNETTQIMEYGFDNFITKNIVIEDTKDTFYDIMGLNYLGEAGCFQSDVWNRKVSSDISLSLTMPADFSISQLDKEIVRKDNSLMKITTYHYGGWELGTATGAFSPIWAPAVLPFENPSPYLELNQKTETVTAEGNVWSVVLEEVRDKAAELFRKGNEVLLDYVKEHLSTVAAAGIVLLAILLLFIFVMIFRATSDMRIRRRRKLEEAERQRRTEEIEQMTAAEIEQELREVMEEERRRKEREQLQRVEAERAARELRETEDLLEELEKERRERMNNKGL